MSAVTRRTALRGAGAGAALLMLAPALRALAATPAEDTKPLRRIAFGSCAKEDQPQPAWDAIAALQPDLFVFLGDNIYGDTEDMAVMRAKYAKLAAVPGFQKLRATCPVIGTWDDHDFGVNDGGAEYPKRKESQKEFLDFFGVPADSPRRTREGVYDAQIFGTPGRRTQVILLDTRYHRSPLKKGEVGGVRGNVANEDPGATILGEAQWKWLEEELKRSAEVRLIASSIQVVPEDHVYEKWMNFPKERERLFRLLRQSGVGGVVFLSGDRHLAELSVMDAGIGYPLYDVTASAINRSAPRWRPQEPNRHRVATMNYGDNFGLIELDWERPDAQGAPDPEVRLQIRDVRGDVIAQQKVPLRALQPGTIRPPQ